MSLVLYRRHTSECTRNRAGNEATPEQITRLSNDRTYRRCRCPIWAEGTLRVDGYIRKSTGEIVWEKAEDLKRSSEDSGHWQRRSAKSSTTAISEEPPAEDEPAPGWKEVPRAVEEFLLARTIAKLTEATLSKYRVLLLANSVTPSASLIPFCEQVGIRHMNQLTGAVVVRFINEWKDGARAALKKHERLWAFFNFCLQRKYATENPIEGLKKPTPTKVIKEPYTEAEMERMFDALHIYQGGGFGGGKIGLETAPAKRLEAMLLLLRYSGLSIGDAVSLRRERLRDNRLMTHRRKTGGEVYVPIPEFVITALHQMPENIKGEEFAPHPDYFFWTGRGLVKSAVSNWQRSFRKLFKLANVIGAHPHRFRHTFAVDLLQRGVPIEDVSMMLGHSSVSITESHYAKWVKARQDALEARVLAAWNQPQPSKKLRRVK